MCADGTVSCSRCDQVETVGLGIAAENAGSQHTSEPDEETTVG